MFSIFGPPNIAKLKASHNISGLVRALAYKKDVHVRQTAMQALREIGTEAVDPLISALESNDGNVRSCAAILLGEIGDITAVNPLIACLSDPLGYVRSNAARSLGKLGDLRAIESLVDASDDERSFVRLAVGEALVCLEDFRGFFLLGRLLRSDSEQYEIRAGAARAISASGRHDAVTVFIEVLDVLRKRGDSFMCELVIDEIRQLKHEFPHWIQSQSVFPRLATVRAIALLNREEIIELLDLLVLALNDEESLVREFTVEPLVKLGSAAVQPVSRALTDPLHRGHLHAAKALGEIGDSRALKPLWISLKDGSREVKREVALALGKIGNEQSVDILLATLADQNESGHVRLAAIEALGLIGDKRAVTSLSAIADDSNSAPYWRDVASASLQRIMSGR